MALVPPTWEPLGEAVGPFGPDELEIREHQERSSQAGQTWQVRIAARPDVVATAMPANAPALPQSLDA